MLDAAEEVGEAGSAAHGHHVGRLLEDAGLIEGLSYGTLAFWGDGAQDAPDHHARAQGKGEGAPGGKGRAHRRPPKGRKKPEERLIESAHPFFPKETKGAEHQEHHPAGG